MAIIVTDKGPIDRHEPGFDVTGLYDAETLKRLMDEGYLAEKVPKAKKTPRRTKPRNSPAAESVEKQEGGNGSDKRD